MKIFCPIILSMLLLFSHFSFSVDVDGDGADAVEEALAGTSDDNAEWRPYWKQTLYGENANDYFGVSLDNVGDVNGDGYNDIIVGALWDDNNGINSGSAHVFSGLDRTVLYTFNGDNAGDEFGYSVSDAGDVNNDGYADIIVGLFPDDTQKVDYVKVFSGVDGSLLYLFTSDATDDWFGYSVSAAGDVNADNYDDVIVGAYLDDDNGTDSGSAQVYSGMDGSILFKLNGDDSEDYFGESVSNAGDVNGDGYDDFIVGAYYDDNNGSGSGSARVFSGINGSILYTFDGDNVDDHFGETVSTAGDVNADGYADVVVGTYRDDNNGDDSGIVRVFSGINGAVLYTIDGDDAVDRFGISVKPAGDVDGDGYSDLIVGAYRDDDSGFDAGTVSVFSGIDGMLLYKFGGDNPDDYFGYSVAGIGDIDGDGKSDMMGGGYGSDKNGTFSGNIRVFLTTDLDNDLDRDFWVNDFDAFPLDPSEWWDTDMDGVGNNADGDDDNDGVTDAVDADPLNDAVTNEIILPLDSTFTGNQLTNHNTLP